jgi:fatty acid desaturase
MPASATDSRTGDIEIVTERLSQRSVDLASNLELLDAATAVSATKTGDKEYLQLRRLVAERGLLDRQYFYYAQKISVAFGLLGASVALLIVANSLWMHMLNAVFMAVIFSQFGFLGHDSGHRQIFRSAKRNDIVLLAAGFVTGMTPSWWQDKHNTHHVSPNQMDRDGDIEVSTFAFTAEQALATKGISRFLVRHQAYLFYPTLLLAQLSLFFGGIAYLVRRERVRYPVLEPLLVLSGVSIYLALIFVFLPPWQGALFVLVHRALGGLYMGSVFAPNHKGMPVLDKDTKLDYMQQQVLTARDVIPSPLVDFWYGGLNYQIEHHLFPNMPRNRMKQAREVVKPFCQSHGLPYHETGVWQSQKEILGYMHEVSAPLRRKAV